MNVVEVEKKLDKIKELSRELLLNTPIKSIIAEIRDGTVTFTIRAIGDKN